MEVRFRTLNSNYTIFSKTEFSISGSPEKLFSPNAGNFLELVQILGNFDGVMSENIRRVSSKQCADHYCSKRIQNELINLLGNKVLQNIQSLYTENLIYYKQVTYCELNHK